MTLTAEKIEARRKWVGGSDAPAIVGVDPWRSAADVWYEKVYGVEPKSNDAMDAGNILEPSVLCWAEKQLGALCDHGVQVVTDDGLLGCTLDATTKTGDVVQAKTACITGPGNPDEWGEEGTDSVPERVLVQAHHEMVVVGAQLAWVPVLIGGRGFTMFRVERDPSLADAVANAGRRFMVENVAKRERPEGIGVALETLSRLRREPGKRVEVADGVVRRYLLAREALKAANHADDEARAALLEAMGDAEIGASSLGIVRMTNVHRKAYSVAESTYRRLTFKESGNG